MFIGHKSNTIIGIGEVEWMCYSECKELYPPDYWAWHDSITTVTGDPPDVKTTVDYSGETGYTVVNCTDEDVTARLEQLRDYIDNPIGSKTIYNIKYYVAKRDSEIVDVPAHKDEDGKDVATTYVQTHFIGDDTAKDARILADEWTNIRTERDKLLVESDWTQGNDTPLTDANVAKWKTYRTSLRDLPSDQSSKTKYSDITWPTKP